LNNRVVIETRQDCVERFFRISVSRLDVFGKRGSVKSSRLRLPKARWVKPQVMLEVEFGGKTGDGLLRHSSYKGIRRDIAEPPKRRRRGFVRLG
jgi:ATP-dependent DNA ligase